MMDGRPGGMQERREIAIARKVLLVCGLLHMGICGGFGVL